MRGGGTALAPDRGKGSGIPVVTCTLTPRARQGPALPQVTTLIPKYLRSCSRKTKVRTV